MPRAAILTALPVEYLAVRAYLTDLHEETHPKGTIYERGRFAADGSTWDVGIVELGVGNPGAALEAERAIAYFNPDVILFVGVAGGIKDVALGDVVASTKVYGYESGKAEETFRPRPEVGLSAYGLEQRARAEARKADWLQRLSAVPSPTPRVFVAPIAAGEKVVASIESEVFQFLRSHYGDAIAVEMEGFGFLDAARANQQVSALVIRGISDLIYNKTEADKEGYQKIAAKHASAFAFELLAKYRLGQSSGSTATSQATPSPSQQAPLALNLPSSAQDNELGVASPKVFITYSHDSQEHKERVLALADRLREDGIDSNIDQYEDSPPEGWQRWMLNQVEASDYALIVCTQQYDRRFRGQEEVGKGKGVTWEGGVIIQKLYDAQGKNSKFIPVTFTPEDSEFIPSPLRSATFYRLGTPDGYELLYRRLTNQPRTSKPVLGKPRTLPPRERKQVSREDSLESPDEDIDINQFYKDWLRWEENARGVISLHENSNYANEVASPLMRPWRDFLETEEWHERIGEILKSIQDEIRGEARIFERLEPLVRAIDEIDLTTNYEAIFTGAITDLFTHNKSIQDFIDAINKELHELNKADDERFKAQEKGQRKSSLQSLLDCARSIRNRLYDIKDELEFPLFGRCFLIMGSVGAGKTHLMLSLLGRRKELEVHANSILSLQDADNQTNKKYLLLPIQLNPTKSIGCIILDLIKEVTNRQWNDLKQFSDFLKTENFRLVIIIDELNEWLYLKRDFQNELITFMAQNTSLHSVFWFISIVDTSYDALVLNKEFWQRYSFISSSLQDISNYSKVQKHFLSEQIPCLSGWLDLDTINFKNLVGFQIIKEALRLEQNSSENLSWLERNWHFVTQLSNFTDKRINGNLKNDRESSIRYWSNPFVAQIILSLIRDGERIEKLIDLNFVRFASKFWEQKLRGFDITIFNHSISEVDEIEIRNKVDNISHFIAKFIVRSKNLSPLRRNLLNYLEEIANTHPDLLPAKIIWPSIKIFINDSLLQQIAAEDSEFSNILSEQILIRFWPFWQWRLSQELLPLVKDQDLDKIKEELESWFQAVELDVFKEGVLEFFLLLLDERKTFQDLSPKFVSDVWLLGLNSQIIPAASVWFAGSRASYGIQRFLGNLAINSVNLVPKPEEDKALRKIFAFIHFVMHAPSTVFSPPGRIKVLQKYYQSIQDLSLADYFFYVVERMFCSVANNSIILECMNYLSGCEVMEIASQLAQLTIETISNNYDDPKSILDLIINYLQVNQAKFCSVRPPEIQKSVPYFYWEWILRYFCRYLVKGLGQNTFEFLDENFWYDPKKYRVSGYIAFKMKQEANFAIGYGYRSLWSNNEKRLFVHTVEKLMNTKRYKEREIAFYLMRHTQSLTSDEGGKTSEPILEKVFHPFLKDIFLDPDVKIQQKVVDNHFRLFSINLKDDFAELKQLRVEKNWKNKKQRMN